MDDHFEIPESDEEVPGNKNAGGSEIPMEPEIPSSGDDGDIDDLLAELEDDPEEEEEKKPAGFSAAAKKWMEGPQKKEKKEKPRKIASQYQKLRMAERQRRKDIEKANAPEIEEFSKLKIVQRKISEQNLKDRLRHTKVIRLKNLAQMYKKKTLPPAWAMVAVLGNKLTKTSAKGGKYLILKLDNLNGISVACFVFGDDAVKTLSKYNLGSVIAVGAPTFMDNEKKKKNDKWKLGSKFQKPDDDIALTVRSAAQILMVGMAKEFGRCKALKKDNMPCNQVINIAYDTYCSFHFQKKFKKTASKRADCNQARMPERAERFKSTGMKNLSKKGTFRHKQMGSVAMHNQIPGVGAQARAKAKRRPGIMSLNPQLLRKPGRGARSLCAVQNALRKTQGGSAKVTLVNKPKTIVPTGNWKQDRTKSRQLQELLRLNQAQKQHENAPKLGRGMGWGSAPQLGRGMNFNTGPRAGGNNIRNKSQLRAMKMMNNSRIKNGDPNKNHKFVAKAPGQPSNSGFSRKRPRPAVGGGQSEGGFKSRGGFGTDEPQKKKVKPMSDFQKAFGGPMTKAEKDRIINDKGRNKDLALEKQFSDARGTINRLVKQEEIEEKKAETTCVTVNVTKCMNGSCPMSRKWIEGRNSLCVNARHQFAKKQGKKYFFECKNCHRKANQINSKHFKGSCPGCGKYQMDAATAYGKQTRAPKEDKLNLRGNERELGRSFFGVAK